jgi:hypothetical protein
MRLRVVVLLEHGTQPHRENIDQNIRNRAFDFNIQYSTP